MNEKELFGSETAKGGFRNEDDVIAKFNDWKKEIVEFLLISPDSYKEYIIKGFGK